LIVKKYLINDLYKLNLWNKNIRDYLLSCNGSIQYIEGLPDSIKKLYPTVWEIPQNELVQQAIDRQPFVDQGQSFNIYSENMSQKEWNSLMFKGWQGGLKTGKYYLHSRAAADPQKFTVDPVKQEEILKIMAKNKTNVSIFQPTNESCDVCSG
jgi:ribonucleotide reductase alpha subunit